VSYYIPKIRRLMKDLVHSTRKIIVNTKRTFSAALPDHIKKTLFFFLVNSKGYLFSYLPLLYANKIEDHKSESITGTSSITKKLTCQVENSSTR
jgi:hypothetical protein